jgi:hypothetical protein
VSLHDWFGRQAAGSADEPLDHGYFVSRHSVCGVPMIKLPGLRWKILAAAGLG